MPRYRRRLNGIKERQTRFKRFPPPCLLFRLPVAPLRTPLTPAAGFAISEARKGEAMNLKDPVRSVLHNKDRQIFSVDPDASVFEALGTMASRGVGSVLVLSGGRLVGILSERDYARKVILKGKSSRETPVREIMTSPATTITPDHTVDECMRLMTENRVRHLPVVENDWIMGVVSIGDLVNWIISAQEHAINQLHSYIAGSYPG